MTDLTVTPPCSCVLCDPAACATFRARRQRRRRWAPAMAHVNERGWHVIGVGGGGEVPDWAFTIGLWHSYRIPEVAVFGLEMRDLMHWVGKAAALLHDRAPTEPDSLISDVVEGYQLRLRPVDVSWHRPLFGTSVGFYRQTPVPIVQLIWPDREHRWPSDGQATSGCRAQPSLWLPVDEHPKGVWTEEAACR